jgi:hypothetical protein
MKGKSLKVLLASCFLVLLTIPLLVASPALAIYSGTEQWSYPTLDLGNPWPDPTIYSFTAPYTFTTVGLINNGSINITGAAIDFSIPQYNVSGQYYGSSYWTGTAQDPSLTFNGAVFTLLNDTITNISVNQNMGATVTFDANHIYVDFQGLAIPQGGGAIDISVTDSNNSSATPIPGAVWLFGSGLAGLIGLKRKYLG